MNEPNNNFNNQQNCQQSPPQAKGFHHNRYNRVFGGVRGLSARRSETGAGDSAGTGNARRGRAVLPQGFARIRERAYFRRRCRVVYLLAYRTLRLSYIERRRFNRRGARGGGDRHSAVGEVQVAGAAYRNVDIRGAAAVRQLLLRGVLRVVGVSGRCAWCDRGAFQTERLHRRLCDGHHRGDTRDVHDGSAPDKSRRRRLVGVRRNCLAAVPYMLHSVLWRRTAA